MSHQDEPRGRTGRALLGAGVVAGAAAGLAGAAYAIERAVVAGVRRRPDPDAGKALVPPFDEAVRYPSHDGGSVYTIGRGKGPPIVFSHGVTLSTRVWVKQFELLPDQGFRCIGFDHRGHGDSECGDSGHSIANLAEDVRTVLERMDLRDAILVGHSMGGIALQAFASQYPEVAAERVRGMVMPAGIAVLVAGLAYGGWSLIAHRHLTSSTGPVIAAGLALCVIAFASDAASIAKIEATNAYVGTAKSVPDSRTPRRFASVINTTNPSESSTLYGARLGSADVIAPPAQSRRIAELIPDARLEVFKGAGHMLMLERTHEVDALISEFARDLGAGAPLRRFWPRRRAARRVRVALAPREAAS